MRALSKMKRWLGAITGLLASLALAGMAIGSGSLAASAAPFTGDSRPATGNWELQAPYPTHFAINGVDMVTPTEAWAVAYTDILHTTDGGATWENQPRPGNDNLYSIHFYDTQHGIAVGNAVFYTRNGGHNWSQGTNAFGYEGEMADANTAFVVDHRSAGYYRSTDGGATWAWRTMSSNINGIVCFDPLNCVATSPSGVYHSTDAGINWTFTAGAGAEFENTTYFVDHNRGWIVTQDHAQRTTDGGATWQTQTLPAGSWIYDVMFADANNGWGVGDNVVRTTDGGNTWEAVPLPPEVLPLWSVDFADTLHGIASGDSFLATESTLVTSTDGGSSWTRRSNGTINSVEDIVALDNSHAWASHVYGGKLSRTTDGGRTWMITNLGNTYMVMRSIDMADYQNGWAVGYETTFLEGRIYRTTDGGVTWFEQYDPFAQYLQSVAALDSQTAITVGGYSATGSIERRTTDGGNTWNDMNLPISDFFSDVFFLDNSTGWLASAAGNIIKTTDGGDTWVQEPTPQNYGLISIHFSDPNNGWAGGSYGTLLHTTNGGSSWTVQDPQIPEFTHVLAVSSTSATHGWIAGYGGGVESRPYVKYTTDGGATWIEDTPPVGPYDSFSALAFLDDDYGWAGGAGGIFLHTPIGYVSPTPTATGQATSTRTATRTFTPTRTPTPSRTPPPPTVTRTPGSTGTPGSLTPTQPPATPIATQTGTLVPPSATGTATGRGTPTITPCPMDFSDVQQVDYFYEAVRFLYCGGVISGYSDGTFRPYNNTTRGQLTKIVVLAEGLPIYTPATPTFVDVPATGAFYRYVETAYFHEIISGYADGTFRPNAQVTRGQITKIVVLAEDWILIDPPAPTFLDVLPGSPFYQYVETAYSREIISGYADGTFRPANNATRGQVTKVVYNALLSMR